MEVKYTEIEGLKIRYASHIAGAKENVLMITPLPESIMAFSPVWASLSEQYNLIAIDLPGMNAHSEGRNDLYAVDAMASFVSKAIDHFSFVNPHLVGPDIGTPIGLTLAAEHPQKIKSLIVGSGACVYPLEIDTFLKDLLAAGNANVYASIPLAEMIDRSLDGFKNYKLPPEIRQDYIALRNNKNWIVKALDILLTYVTTIPVVDKKIELVSTPVQIIWGRNDPIATVKNAELLHARLQKSKLHIIEDGAHYIWEENSAEYLHAVVEWLNGGYTEF